MLTRISWRRLICAWLVPSTAAGLVALLAASAASAQCELKTLLGQTVGQSTSLGSAVALHGQRMAVRGSTGGTQFVQMYVRGADGWSQDAVLYPTPASNTLSTDVALSDTTLLVGAFSTSVGGTTGAGIAHVYELVGAAWTHTGTLEPPLPETSGRFGYSLALEDDVAVIGAPGQGAGGEALVYRRNGGAWTLEQVLALASPVAIDEFGSAVAVDAGRLLIGAPGRMSAGKAQAGIVSVYEHDGAQWKQVAKLGAAPAVAGDRFGRACALDGERALIGSDDRAFVFEHGAAAWNQAALLMQPLFKHDFGARVSIAGDVALVASPVEYSKLPGGDLRGFAYVYNRLPGGWALRDELRSCQAAASDGFARALTLDGNTAAITDVTHPGTGNSDGVAFVYTSAPGMPALSCPISACKSALDTPSGGVQDYWINAGFAYGSRIGLLLSSLSGSLPGIAIDGWTLPLNPDALFQFTLATPNQAPFSNTLGVLNPGGALHPRLALPPGVATSLAGSFVTSAYVVIDLGGGVPTVTYASPSVRVGLTP